MSGMAFGSGVDKHMSYELIIDILQVFANAFSWQKYIFW